MTQIHEAILGAMADIAKTGIAKLSKNKDQGYNFRGIEAAMNELSAILITHKIAIESAYCERSEKERPTKSGGMQAFVTVKGRFTFSAPDGSSKVMECYGEGADTSDKATSKAQTVAFRTALFQQFVVPFAPVHIDPEDGGERQDGLKGDAMDAAEQGLLAYQAFWAKLDAKGKKELQAHHAELKAIAQEADRTGAAK